MIGNKQDVRLAITRLTVQGRIKRVRGELNISTKTLPIRRKKLS
jgi:hypothetical protein